MKKFVHNNCIGYFKVDNETQTCVSKHMHL